MQIRKRMRLLNAGKSPSLEAMKRTYNRALASGGVTQDFSANVENIRSVNRTLSYTNGNVFFKDAPFVYVPSSYGESKNFAQVQNKRNLLQWSEEFDNAYWITDPPVITRVANTITAPNGTLTADKITENTSNTQQAIYTFSGYGANTYTVSVYAKSAERNFIRLTLSDNGANNSAAVFDLSIGIISTAISSNGSVIGKSATIVNAGNGWYRCSIAATIPFSTVYSTIHIRSTNSFSTYTGTIGNGIYIWGAQLETGQYATPYQKTVALGDGIVDLNFTRATSATVTNKLGVIEDSCYNRLVNSATGTTQSITVAAGTYNLSFFGTGSYTLSGVGSGVLTGAGASTRVNQSFTCTAGTLTLTVSGSITNVQFSLGGLRDYIKTTNRLNVPRLDYSRGLGKPELLIERASTNLMLQSQNLSAVLTPLNITLVANATLAPDNTVSATAIFETVAIATHEASYLGALSLTSGTVYSFIVHVKPNGRDKLVISQQNFTSVYFFIDLPSKTMTSSSGTFFNAPIIVSLVNGWYKITWSSAATTTTTGGIKVDVQTVNPAGTNNFLGDVTKGLYVWGFQVELGSNATTYIPTTTTTVTRNAETNYVDLWNNSLLNKTNWTLFTEGFLYDGQVTNMSLCLSDSTTATSNTNQIGWYNLNTPFYNISNTRTNSGLNSTNNSFNKFIIQYNNGIVNFYRNGVNIWSNKSIPVFDYRYLVLNSGGSTFTTDKISLFNRTLTNTECTTLTT